MNWRKPSTTYGGDGAGRFKVVHPFHPLSGREFELVGYSHTWGEHRGVLHKLSDIVLEALEAALAEDPTLNSAAMAGLVFEQFGLRVHPRSVERAPQRRRKKGASNEGMKIIAGPTDLEQGYEALRAQAVGEIPSVTPRGLALFLRAGLPAWMSACAPVTRPTLMTRSSTDGRQERRLSSLSTDLVGVLTEMALGSRRRCYA